MKKNQTKSNIRRRTNISKKNKSRKNLLHIRKQRGGKGVSIAVRYDKSDKNNDSEIKVEELKSLVNYYLDNYDIFTIHVNGMNPEQEVVIPCINLPSHNQDTVGTRANFKDKNDIISVITTKYKFDDTILDVTFFGETKTTGEYKTPTNNNNSKKFKKPELKDILNH